MKYKISDLGERVGFHCLKIGVALEGKKLKYRLSDLQYLKQIEDAYLVFEEFKIDYDAIRMHIINSEEEIRAV